MRDALTTNAASGLQVDAASGRVYRGARRVDYSTADGYSVVLIRSPDGEAAQLVLTAAIVWEATHGPLAEGVKVQHRNGDRKDNRIANLQVAKS